MGFVVNDRAIWLNDCVVGLVFDQIDRDGYAALAADPVERGIKEGESALCIAVDQPSIDAAISKLLKHLRGLQ